MNIVGFFEHNIYVTINIIVQEGLTMAILNCTVGNCHHNKESLCFLEGIEVKGEEAKVSDSTLCGSFKERTEDTFSNIESQDTPSKTAAIDCKAVECNYSNDCKCNAGQIHISGPNAHENCDTKCSTFICK